MELRLSPLRLALLGTALVLVAQFVSLPVALATAAGLLALAAVPVAVAGRASPARRAGREP